MSGPGLTGPIQDTSILEQRRAMSAPWKTLTLVSLLSLTVAACGVRGSLDAPEEGAIDNVERAQPRDADGNVVADKQHDSFVLDGLIR